MNNKREFVEKLSEVLTMAKPHLRCEYVLGKDIPLTDKDILIAEIHGVDRPYDSDGDYVLVHCDNGYRYEINVSGNSLCAIAEDVFSQMVCK